MRAVDQVLSRVFVKRFYSENTGFFLVLLGVCFGFLKAPQHFELNAALADRPVLYLIPFSLWVLYAVKVARFCSIVNRERTSAMLGWISLAGRSSIFRSAFKVQLNLMFPVFGYGLFMAYVAMEEGAMGSALLVVGFLFLLVLILAYWHFKDLLQPREFGLVARKSRFHWSPKYYFKFYLHYLTRLQGLRLIMIKLLSLVILYIAVQVFFEEAVDLRYLTLGALLSATANSFFAFDYVRFERSQLFLFRNLPLSFMSRVLAFWLTFILLSIPEFVILLGQLSLQIGPIELLSLLLVIPCLLLFFMGLVYQPGMHQERFTKQVFFISASLFFVVLGHIGALTLALCSMATAVLLLKAWKHKSEAV